MINKFANLIVAISIGMLLCACGNPKPQIDHQAVDTTSVIDEHILDTTKILVSELPVKFDSTDILLFAIGLVDLQDRGGYIKIGSDSYSSTEMTSAYFSNDNLYGNFINIVFQDKNGHQKKLTDRKIKIRSVNFLRALYERTKVGYLLYSISDRDSNGDKKLDQTDLEALYISNLDGSGFKKVTKELHELYDWSSIEGENRIYLRTLEDRNKDGVLNNKDQFHYYFIDFSGDTYSVSEHNPLKVFE